MLLLGIGYLNYDYLKDPVYWRRWWDLLSHAQQPDHMNFSPTVVVQSDRPALLPAAPTGATSIPADALRAAESYAREFDSFALIVVHRGRVQTEWYRDDWQRDRLTQSQSMMKTLTAIMTGLALEDGHIGSLDDPVSLYLPEWQGDARGEMTVRQLLWMTSGLARSRFTFNPFARDSSFRFLNSSDRLPVLFATPLVFEPGAKFDYNDIAAQLAGTLVERAVGRPYAEYFLERFWNPLGGRNAELWLDREGGSAMTACCLLASAMDWARVGEMLKDRGRIDEQQVVPADWIEAMITPSPNYAGYGYFTWLGPGMTDRAQKPGDAGWQSEPFAVDDLFILQGYGGQRVYVSRSADLVIVRLGPFAGMRPLKEGWDNAKLPNLLIRGLGLPGV